MYSHECFSFHTGLLWYSRQFGVERVCADLAREPRVAAVLRDVHVELLGVHVQTALQANLHALCNA